MENSNIKVIKFADFNNLEYRKGSQEFGGILTKLMEFIRLYKKVEDNDLKFNLTDFLNQTNITLEEITKLANSIDNGYRLYSFDIQLDNDFIYLLNLNKKEKEIHF